MKEVIKTRVVESCYGPAVLKVHTDGEGSLSFFHPEDEIDANPVFGKVAELISEYDVDVNTATQVRLDGTQEYLYACNKISKGSPEVIIELRSSLLHTITVDRGEDQVPQYARLIVWQLPFAAGDGGNMMVLSAVGSISDPAHEIYPFGTVIPQEYWTQLDSGLRPFIPVKSSRTVVINPTSLEHD